MSNLFARTPTNDEKRYYAIQWGGVKPWRCAVGMVTFLIVGFILGAAVF